MLSTNNVARAPSNPGSRCSSTNCMTNSPNYVCPPNYQLSVPFTYTGNNAPDNWDDFVIRFCTRESRGRVRQLCVCVCVCVCDGLLFTTL
jgi:hypothetical protein